MKLDYIFSVKSLAEEIENKFRFRDIVFLGKEERLKRELSAHVNIVEEAHAVYSEKTAAVILYIPQNFDFLNYEICLDSGKKQYLVFENIAAFLDFNFKTPASVCLIPTIISLKKEDLICAVSKLIGYLSHVEDAEFKSIFFGLPLASEAIQLKQRIKEAVSIICGNIRTNLGLADFIFLITKIKELTLNKKISSAEIALKNYIYENRIPYKQEFLVIMQMLIFKMNTEFLKGGEFNKVAGINFYKRLRMFWENHGEGKPNFEFAMDNDICKLKLSKVFRRLYLMEEELFNLCSKAFELIKTHPETRLFIDVLNEDKVVSAVKYTPEHNEFCMLSILRNFGYLEVI